MGPDLEPLTQEQIAEKLMSFPGWKYADNKISKEFTFPSFTEAVALVDKLVPYCNSIDHHPDIYIYYKRVVFSLTRFSVGGKVTERDFTVAGKIENLFKQMTEKK